MSFTQELKQFWCGMSQHQEHWLFFSGSIGHSQLSITPVPGASDASPGLQGHQENTWCTDKQASKTPIHIKQKTTTNSQNKNKSNYKTFVPEVKLNQGKSCPYPLSSFPCLELAHFYPREMMSSKSLTTSSMLL